MTSTAFSIRQATQADHRQLERLALLDSSRLDEDRYAVAEMGGEIVAAVSIDSGRAIADPFRPTADLVELLRTHIGSAVGRSRRLTLSVRRPAMAS